MKLIFNLSILIICSTLFSCYGDGRSSSIAELQKDVLEDISNSTMALDNDVNPTSIKLIKISNGKYQGALITTEQNSTYTYDIKVETTGPIFEWEIISDGEELGTTKTNQMQSTYPCDMNSSELYDFVTKNNFSLNGNGRVVFDRNNNIYIYGGRADLRGSYSTSYGSVSISNLQATSGYFDPSNNNGSSGIFSFDCSGNLNGSLHSRGQSRSVSITKE